MGICKKNSRESGFVGVWVQASYICLVVPGNWWRSLSSMPIVDLHSVRFVHSVLPFNSLKRLFSPFFSWIPYTDNVFHSRTWWFFFLQFFFWGFIIAIAAGQRLGVSTIPGSFYYKVSFIFLSSFYYKYRSVFVFFSLVKEFFFWIPQRIGKYIQRNYSIMKKYSFFYGNLKYSYGL